MPLNPKPLAIDTDYHLCVCLQEEAVGQDPSVFFSVDFYLHETQATQVVASNRPAFNTVIQYVVEQELFLVEHLDTHILELELNK
jgi:hypothetical protein